MILLITFIKTCCFVLNLFVSLLQIFSFTLFIFCRNTRPIQESGVGYNEKFNCLSNTTKDLVIEVY